MCRCGPRDVTGCFSSTCVMDEPVADAGPEWLDEETGWETITPTEEDE